MRKVKEYKGYRSETKLQKENNRDALKQRTKGERASEFGLSKTDVLKRTLDAARFELSPRDELALSQALDCGFCGMRCDAIFVPQEGGFNSFEKLAQHILFCPWAPIPRSSADLDVVAAQILARARIFDAIAEGKEVAKAFVPKAASADGSEDGFVGTGFLKATDLGTIDPKTQRSNESVLTVLGFEEMQPSQFKPDVERFGIQVKYKGDTRLMGVDVNGVNHRLLTEALGKSPAKWIGKRFSVCAMKGKFPNPFIAVVKE